MKTVFIANRGEIAARIARSVRASGLRAVVAAPECDAGLPYTREADECLPLASPRDFVSVEAMVAAARAAAADAVHPGYGFLSEDPRLARSCAEHDLVFVGPDPETIALMADKASACAVAASHGIAVLSAGHGSVDGAGAAAAVGADLGYPVMLKAVAGGGGMGMAVARTEHEVEDAFRTVSSRARSLFDDARVLVERWVERARHVEVQVMGLPDGRVVTMAPRDCSVQRRHQKVLEETPAPGLRPRTRDRLAEWAATLAAAVDYRGAGTVEFLVDADDPTQAWFLEMNTRLQVEHPITEAVHGVDLVAWQLAVARGESTIPPGFSVEPSGHAFELRLYAEDPVRFLPRPGRITEWQMPSGDGVRVDPGYACGTEVTPFFDPLLAKLVTTGETREAALALARQVVAETRVEGPGCNLPFLARVLEHDDLMAGCYDTGLVGRMMA